MRAISAILTILLSLIALSGQGQSLAGEQRLAFEKQAPFEKIQELLGKPRAEKIQIIEKLGVVVREVEFTESRMLGQYLDLAHYPGLEKPEIRLAKGTDDWTLIHEYTHALIAASKKPHPLMLYTDYEKANADLLESWTAYTTTWHYASVEHREKVLKNFLTVSRYKMEQLQQFELEEIAIENYLRQIYLKQKPAEFSIAAFDISTSYLKKSGTAALSALKSLSEGCVDVIASYDREHLPVPASLSGLCTLVKIYHGEVLDILARAKIRVYEPIGDK
jgi:hypothetical protein